MMDLTNKYISTENNSESENLLKMAIAQGYKTEIGEHALESKRLFHFAGFPYKAISTPAAYQALMWNVLFDIVICLETKRKNLQKYST